MPRSLQPEVSSRVVLCIDDNQDLLECEKAFLETFGYTVLTAPSDGKGLELASIHSFDVVIVDYFMPEMNGQEIAIEMRRVNPRAAIIMFSAAVDVPKQALNWVDAFVAKDCLASQLLPVIAQLHRGGHVPLLRIVPKTQGRDTAPKALTANACRQSFVKELISGWVARVCESCTVKVGAF